MSAGLAGLAVELVGDASDERGWQEIAEAVDSRLALFGLAEHPQAPPAPRPLSPGEPAAQRPTNYGVDQWQQWNRIKTVVLPETARRMKRHAPGH